MFNMFGRTGPQQGPHKMGLYKQENVRQQRDIF